MRRRRIRAFGPDGVSLPRKFMNPDTNKFEALKEVCSIDTPQRSHFVDELVADWAAGKLLRHDGSEVPKHWAIFKVGELVVIKDYTFKVAYIGETAILFEPVEPQIVGDKCCKDCK